MARGSPGRLSSVCAPWAGPSTRASAHLGLSTIAQSFRSDAARTTLSPANDSTMTLSREPAGTNASAILAAESELRTKTRLLYIGPIVGNAADQSRSGGRWNLSADKYVGLCFFAYVLDVTRMEEESGEVLTARVRLFLTGGEAPSTTLVGSMGVLRGRPWCRGVEENPRLINAESDMQASFDREQPTTVMEHVTCYTTVVRGIKMSM